MRISTCILVLILRHMHATTNASFNIYTNIHMHAISVCVCCSSSSFFLLMLCVRMFIFSRRPCVCVRLRSICGLVVSLLILMLTRILYKILTWGAAQRKLNLSSCKHTQLLQLQTIGIFENNKHFQKQKLFKHIQKQRNFKRLTTISTMTGDQA